GRPDDRRMARRRPRSDDRPGRDRVQRHGRSRDARLVGRNPRRRVTNAVGWAERSVPSRSDARPIARADASRPSPPPSTEIITFGCRLNALESEVMRTKAAEAGLSDAVLINTCAVTAE